MVFLSQQRLISRSASGPTRPDRACPGSTYIPSTRDMLHIVLGAQAGAHVAEVHLFGDYLNLCEHTAERREEWRAPGGGGVEEKKSPTRVRKEGEGRREGRSQAHPSKKKEIAKRTKPTKKQVPGCLNCAAL